MEKYENDYLRNKNIIESRFIEKEDLFSDYVDFRYKYPIDVQFKKK